MNILDWIGYVFGYVIFFGYKISGVYVAGAYSAKNQGIAGNVPQ